MSKTDKFDVRVIELIPPVHRRVYKMGMGHFGVVIGDSVYVNVHSWPIVAIQLPGSGEDDCWDIPVR